jgi:hypothetical protein
MKIRAWFLGAACLAAFVLTASAGLRHVRQEKAAPQAAAAAANPKDVESVDAFLAALYGVISGPAGPRDWNRFRSLFIPEARLIAAFKKPDGTIAYRAMTVEGYIEGGQKYFQEKGFFEREISRKTERFGSVTHVFSTYESREAADGKPFARGINSIQLFYDGRRWWGVTIFWDSERPDQPIPAQYLPK